MTEIYKKYRLTSNEETTDEMLEALMEDVAQAARESSNKAETEKQRRLSEAVHTIAVRRSQRKHVLDDFRHHYVNITFTYHLDAKKKD